MQDGRFELVQIILGFFDEDEIQARIKHKIAEEAEPKAQDIEDQLFTRKGINPFTTSK